MKTKNVKFTFDDRSLASVEEMQSNPIPLHFTIEDFAVANNLLIQQNTSLEAQLATLRNLWTSLPAGTREGLREYHLATYRQWCAALGVSDET